MTKISIVAATCSADIDNEERYKRLNELGFVRGVNGLDQWLILVNDAWRLAQIPENELVRDYLVIMLNRFMNRPELFALLSAFDYCRHVLGVRNPDAPCIEDVAAISLQSVAFFPERSEYRHEPRSVEYRTEIGVTLYQQLASEAADKDDWFSKAYRAMATSFGQAVIVLRSMNPNFMHRGIAMKPQYADGQLMLTDHDAQQVATEASLFGMMYCAQPGILPSCNN